MQSPSIVPPQHKQNGMVQLGVSHPQQQQRHIIWTKDQRDRRAWEYREHFLRNRKPIHPFRTICEEAKDNHCPKNGPALLVRRKLSRRCRVIIPTNQGPHCGCEEKLSTLSMEDGNETCQTPYCSQKENLSTLFMEGGHEETKVGLPSNTDLQKATRCRSSGHALARWVRINLKTCLSKKLLDKSNAAREVNGS